MQKKERAATLHHSGVNNNNTFESKETGGHSNSIHASEKTYMTEIAVILQTDLFGKGISNSILDKHLQKLSEKASQRMSSESCDSEDQNELKRSRTMQVDKKQKPKMADLIKTNSVESQEDANAYLRVTT